MHDLPILIIGSGCTGLSIAQGLKKAGIPCIVFERAPSIDGGERDWNMGLHWAAPTLVSLLPPTPLTQTQFLQQLQVDVHNPTLDIDQLRFFNGATGDLMLETPVNNFYRLQRSKLRSKLSADLDIRFCKKLIGLEFHNDNGGVTAAFEDGSSVKGRMIIGADGSRSIVRRSILPSPASVPRRLPYAATFIQAKYTRDQALFLRSFHPLYLAAPHPQGLFAFFGLQEAPDPDDPSTWTFFFYVSWPCSIEEQDREMREFGDKERWEQVVAMGKQFADPWKSAYNWLKGDEKPWYHALGVWDPDVPENHWDNRNGRVTLAGDAAHPMTFQRGQGLNHAIADVGVLVAALDSISAEKSQKQAIDEYEKEMRVRAGEEVKLSITNTRMVHDWQRVVESPVFSKGIKKNGTE